MLNKNENEQEIGNVEGSTVNQAGGNIITNNYGLSASDVIAIVRSLVASELANYTKEANKTAKERAEKFSEKLVEEVADKVMDKMNRFNEPSVQWATRQATLGYVKSGDEKQKNDLIDMLIERVKVEEQTTEQNLIDEAIKILPMLSKKTLAIQTLISFRLLSYHGNCNAYRQWLINISPILENCKRATALDIAFLQQVGCATSLPSMIVIHKNFEEELLKNEDLFFRHEISGNEYHQLISSLGLTENNEGIAGFNNMEEVRNIMSILSLRTDKKRAVFNVCDTQTLNKIKSSEAFERFKDGIQTAQKLTVPFNANELKQAMIEISPSWNVGFELLNRSDVKCLMPTAVGNYIACRQLSRIGGQEIGVNAFYQN